jgi:hypothetical protein
LVLPLLAFGELWPVTSAVTVVLFDKGPAASTADVANTGASDGCGFTVAVRPREKNQDFVRCLVELAGAPPSGLTNRHPTFQQRACNTKEAFHDLGVLLTNASASSNSNSANIAPNMSVSMHKTTGMESYTFCSSVLYVSTTPDGTHAGYAVNKTRRVLTV